MLANQDVIRLKSFMEKGRSKYEVLRFAQQTLVPDNYRRLEQAIEQGFETQDRYAPYVVSRAFQDWCETFDHSCVGVHSNGSIHILCRTTETPSEDQIDELKHLEWGKFALMKGCMYIRLPGDAYEGPVGLVIQDALDILDLPFARGLPPPPKNRYERLMDEDTLQV